MEVMSKDLKDNFDLIKGRGVIRVTLIREIFSLNIKHKLNFQSN